MKTNALVLGAGIVGSAMAYALSQDGRYHVTLADKHQVAPSEIHPLPGVRYTVLDSSNAAALAETAKSAHIVLGALPERIGFSVLQELLLLEIPYVDVSFFEQELDSLRTSSKSLAIVDCGVAPGLSHMLVGDACSRLQTVEDIRIYVGGLPVTRTLPWEYKAVFSPSGVLDEYTRPARVIEAGEEVVLEALSEIEEITFPETGTLEAFNTDGLRSLLRSGLAPRMREKTLRYPGHAEKITFLKDIGFFSTESLTLDDASVTPREVAEALLFPQWRLLPTEDDITVMRIEVHGSNKDTRKRCIYSLSERRDPHSGLSAMARCTGFTAAVSAMAIIDGVLNETGVLMPEKLGQNSAFMDYLREGLGKFNVQWTYSEETDA